MTVNEIDEFVRNAEEIYRNQLQARLERDYMDQFVAIEPKSGEYFLGETLNAASQAAREAYPDRPTHAMRIGHRAALHFGLNIR